jgi:hypothetical protein
VEPPKSARMWLESMTARPQSISPCGREWLIGERIGGGGFGQVYAARSIVACKPRSNACRLGRSVRPSGVWGWALEKGVADACGHLERRSASGERLREVWAA